MILSSMTANSARVTGSSGRNAPSNPLTTPYPCQASIAASAQWPPVSRNAADTGAAQEEKRTASAISQTPAFRHFNATFDKPLSETEFRCESIQSYILFLLITIKEILKRRGPFSVHLADPAKKKKNLPARSGGRAARRGRAGLGQEGPGKRRRRGGAPEH